MSTILASRRAALAAGAALFGHDARAPRSKRPRRPRSATRERRRRAAPGSNGDLVQGFSRERLARLGPAFAREAERGSFPGCVALVARSGRSSTTRPTATRTPRKTKRMGRDAIFLMASMTKPVTSVAAMMLVEEGRMKLSDPISNWMPELRDLKVERRREGQDAEEVALDRPVTVQDLLRHTSGLRLPRQRAVRAHQGAYEDEQHRGARPAPSPATRC